jgi:hypothetical protein
MATFGGANIVTDNLVLWLDAANRSSYPGSGTTWRDMSGNNNNGTLTNGPTFSSTNQGSILLDGVDDLINFGNNSTLYDAYNASFTQQYFIKLISNASTLKTIFRVDDWSRIYIEISTSQINFSIGYSSPVDSLLYNTVIQYNKWYSLCVVWTKLSTQKMYLDGILVAERVPTVTNYTGITNSFGGANLGRGHTNPYNTNINANIAIFAHYNRALSPSEVQQNYDALKSRYLNQY